MQNSPLPKGIFTISIDYEFGWGRMKNGKLPEGEEKVVRSETEITRRLLLLFEEFRVPAMWAIVSRLLDESQNTHDPLWFDSEKLIPQILSSKVMHEIGSHSWGHVDYGDTSKADTIKEDIEKARLAHEHFGFQFNSFIFPWNREGFHKELKEAGIVCFRSSTRQWYSAFPGFLRRLSHFLDYFLPFTTPTVLPVLHSSGLVDIGDSMLLLDRGGMRKLIPSFAMKQKAVWGLHKATAAKRVFHLWFHPSNLSFEPETQFAILREVLETADKLRKEGKLDILTMSQIA